MALIEDALKGNAVTGLAAGIGTVVLAPLVVPAIAWVVRPMATVAVQAGMEIYRGTVAPIGAAVSNLVAEAQAELGDSPARKQGRDTPDPISNEAKDDQPKAETTGSREARGAHTPRRTARSRSKRTR